MLILSITKVGLVVPIARDSNHIFADEKIEYLEQYSSDDGINKQLYLHIGDHCTSKLIGQVGKDGGRIQRLCNGGGKSR